MDLIKPRKRVLDLSNIDISNKEWLYLIKNDTRHSLSIEGIVSNEKQLKDIIKGNYDDDDEILNYFSTAKSMYSYAIELYKDKEFVLSKATLRHIQKSILDSSLNTSIKGVFRKTSVTINNAPNINPPDGDIDLWIDSWIRYVEYALDKYNIYEAIARIHNFFEGIHPFNDGNGRTGRIIINYILLLKGYPNIVIKGLKESDKKFYYKALENGDLGVNSVFKDSPNQSPESIDLLLNKGDFSKLENLIKSALIESMDKYICMNETEYYSKDEVANIFSVKPDTISKQIRRGKFVAKKENNNWIIPKKYVNLLKNSKSKTSENIFSNDLYCSNDILKAFNYCIGICGSENMNLLLAVENKNKLNELNNFLDIKSLIKNENLLYKTKFEVKINFITKRTTKKYDNSILLGIKISPAFYNKISNDYNFKVIVAKDQKDILRLIKMGFTEL